MKELKLLKKFAFEPPLDLYAPRIVMFHFVDSLRLLASCH